MKLREVVWHNNQWMQVHMISNPPAGDVSIITLRPADEQDVAFLGLDPQGPKASKKVTPP